ncbi:MAG: phosphoadenosine phosphosulfate reductase [Rhodobacterales bacterium]|nr:MAG: phosphoadenosine phosphosulfate reductase [Rhodobacterales bacterium]
MPQDHSHADWAPRLHAIAAERGLHTDLDGAHHALFVEGSGQGGGTLVVNFERLDDPRQSLKADMPREMAATCAGGWSALGILAHGWTWYRSPAVWDFFDELRDEGFFRGFERVIFRGASSGGYAACAYSSASPGATVIAFGPQATLDRSVTKGWEPRFRQGWACDFTGRYGYAPEEVLAAQDVFLLFDPFVFEDAMHAALFDTPNVTRLRLPHLGGDVHQALARVGVLTPLLEGLYRGELDARAIHALLAQRRHHPFFQKRMLSLLTERGRPARIAQYCAAVLDDSAPTARPHFAAALEAARG